MKTPEDWRSADATETLPQGIDEQLRLVTRMFRSMTFDGTHAPAHLKDLSIALVPGSIAPNLYLIGKPEDLDSVRVNPRKNDEGGIEIALVDPDGNVKMVYEAQMSTYRDHMSDVLVWDQPGVAGGGYDVMDVVDSRQPWDHASAPVHVVFIGLTGQQGNQKAVSGVEFDLPHASA